MEYWDAHIFRQRAASVEQSGRIGIFHTAIDAWASIFGDLKGFIARTWAYIATIAVMAGLVDWATLAWKSEERLDALYALAYFAAMPVAVQWHRYVLMGEDRRGVAALRLKGREVVFLLSLIGVNAAIAIASLLARGAARVILGIILGDSAFTVKFVELSGVTAALWAGARLILVPPFRALDQSDSFGLSAHLTKRHAFPIIAVELLSILPMWALGSAASAAFVMPTQSAFVIVSRSLAAAIMAVGSACVLAAMASLLMKALGSGFIPKAIPPAAHESRERSGETP